VGHRRIVDRGRGTPLVLIPGLQGRWEYQRATVDALAESFRVITFSLADDPRQTLDAVDTAGVERAIICGISYGGLLAIRFAAHHPERTSALILVSTPGPQFRLRPRHEFYARLPWLFGPLFLAETPFRLQPELLAALPDRRDRWRFRWNQVRTVVTSPLSLPRMAARARGMSSFDRLTECARVAAPTLIVTGEPALDYVVTAGGTAEYASLIRGATLNVLPRTGHLGSVTRAREFSAIVREFVARSQAAEGGGPSTASLRNAAPAVGGREDGEVSQPPRGEATPARRLARVARTPRRDGRDDAA
jgi:pimeloyl-ACP methyl ester carboxylesterase